MAQPAFSPFAIRRSLFAGKVLGNPKGRRKYGRPLYGILPSAKSHEEGSGEKRMANGEWRISKDAPFSTVTVATPHHRFASSHRAPGCATAIARYRSWARRQFSPVAQRRQPARRE